MLSQVVLLSLMRNADGLDAVATDLSVALCSRLVCRLGRLAALVSLRLKRFDQATLARQHLDMIIN